MIAYGHDTSHPVETIDLFQGRKSRGFCFDTLKDKVDHSYFFVTVKMFILFILEIISIHSYRTC